MSPFLWCERVFCKDLLPRSQSVSTIKIQEFCRSDVNFFNAMVFHFEMTTVVTNTIMNLATKLLHCCYINLFRWDKNFYLITQNLTHDTLDSKVHHWRHKPLPHASLTPSPLNHIASTLRLPLRVNNNDNKSKVQFPVTTIVVVCVCLFVFTLTIFTLFSI